MPNKTIKIRDFTRGLYLGPDPSESPRGTTVYNRGMHPLADKTWRSRDGSAQLHALNSAHSLYYFADIWFSGVSTSFYRTTVAKKTGLSGDRLSFAKMPPTAGREDWLFVAGGGVLFKSEDDGTITNWGIEPPENNPSVADAAVAGNLDGKYYYTVTFRNSETGHRSNAPTIDADSALLIHADGADASTTFTDASPNGLTITARYAAEVDTAQSVFGGGSLLLVPSAFLETADNAAFSFGSGDFTIECWARFNAAEGMHTIYFQNDSTATDFIEFSYDFETEAFYFAVYDGGSRIIFNKSDVTLAADTWYHIALVRGWSGTANLFAVVVDGGDTLLDTFSDASAMPDHDGVVQIGSTKLNGTSGSQKEFDAGETGHAITFNNGPYISRSSASKFGRGALFFDGSDDNLSIPTHADWDILNEANFTIDMFVRHDSVASVDCYLSQVEDGNNYWFFYNDPSNGLYFAVYSGGGWIVTCNSAAGDAITSTGTWYHLAVCKVGDEYGIYKDGVQIAYLDDDSADAFVGSLYVGSRSAADYFGGRINNLRITHTNAFSAAPNVGKTDTITVPTAPHDSATDTKLLIYGENREMEGWIDEIRVSSIARYTSFFSVSESAFSSAAEASQTVAASQMTITNIPTAADPQVDQVELWRTIGGGTAYFLLVRLDEGTTGFTDNIDDTDLGDSRLLWAF